jgi:hypothetical protein
MFAITTRDLSSVTYPAAAVLVAVVLVSLLLRSREVVSAAMNH